MKKECAQITSVQRFSVHDGPGTRTTVFFKGCPLRCFWCHNPETQLMVTEVSFEESKCIGCGACGAVCPNGKRALFSSDCIHCGRCAAECYTGALRREGQEITLDDLTAQIVRDREMYRLSGGGVTFSGGEPFCQSGFLCDMLKRCRDLGIHTAVETAAAVPYDNIAQCLPYIDLLYCDIKTMDPQKHRDGCGADNGQILQNIRALCRTDLAVVFRTPVIPGFNDDEESIRAICRFLREQKAGPKLELLEFHGWCENKYHALGRDYAAASLAADKEKLAHLRAVVQKELTI